MLFSKSVFDSNSMQPKHYNCLVEPHENSHVVIAATAMAINAGICTCTARIH